jgi:uncharacterized protein (DUF697 family)
MAESERIPEGNGNEKVEKIILSHVVYSMTAGAIPLPLADIAAVTAIQLDMIRQIAAHHGAAYDNDSGKSLITSLAGATLARLGASAIKAIPGVGTVVGIGAQVILSGASTYALGRVFDSHFSGQGSIFDVNVESMKKAYQDMLEKGREVASSLRKSSGNGDIPGTIEKLKALRDSGAITEEEFEQTKKKLLEKLGA